MALRFEPIRKLPPIPTILAIYIAIQAFAITGGFFPLDDPQELFRVKTLDSWWHIFGVDCYGLFRPVKNLFFALFSAVPSDMTWLCRVMAIAVGCVSLFPVLALFRRIFRDERQALFAAAVWMLAPTLVSSVAWLSCVNIQAMCALGALTIVLHDKAFDGDSCSPRVVFAAAVTLFLSLVSYESAVVVGPLVVVFDFYLRPRRFLTKRAIGTYCFYASITLIYLVLREKIGSNSSLNGSFVDATRIDMMFASAYFTCQHFCIWLNPFGKMSPFGAYSPGMVSTSLLASCWAVVFGLVVLAFALRRRCPIIAFGIAFALVSFLPVSNVLGFGNGPYGDYYMGLPSVGLATVTVFLCKSALAVRGRARNLGFAIAITLIVSRVFAVGEAARWAWLWADGARACKAGMAAFPSAFWNYIQYAEICYETGRFVEMHECRDKLEVQLGADSEHLVLIYQYCALEAMNIKRNADLAMQNLDKALQVDKKGVWHRNTRFYRGCVFEDLLGDDKSAEAEYRAAVEGKWSVDTPAAADRLARLLAIRGELDEAESLWVRAVKLRPDDPDIQHNLLVLKRSKSINH